MLTDFLIMVAVIVAALVVLHLIPVPDDDEWDADLRSIIERQRFADECRRWGDHDR